MTLRLPGNERGFADPGVTQEDDFVETGAGIAAQIADHSDADRIRAAVDQQFQAF
jgi:hypothetical protein